MASRTFEDRIRGIISACANCDECRYHMDTACHFFPELYRLHDAEKAHSREIPADALKALVDRCNFCGLCPCPDIRTGIMTAKTDLVARNGLPPSLRLLEDVGLLGRICGAYPKLTNRLLGRPAVAAAVKRASGIHRERKLPAFGEHRFDRWARRHLSMPTTAGTDRRKVAYFIGCTGRYLFPQVPTAAVSVLQDLGMDVMVPDQGCCGMPPLLEGDRPLSLSQARTNLNHLADAVEKGYEIVCACPTCGYMLRQVIPEGAYLAPEYQSLVGGDEVHVKVPLSQRPVRGEERRFRTLNRLMYGDPSARQGYFSDLDPIRRIQVAEHTWDLGEFLADHLGSRDPKRTYGPVEERTVYYPPCHLREQNIGRPWLDLLSPIPGPTPASVEGSFHCCGMAGIMGFKRRFHRTSLEMGTPLMEKIQGMAPDLILTDCLSCRLQFLQMGSIPVRHPVEILHRSLSASAP